MLKGRAKINCHTPRHVPSACVGAWAGVQIVWIWSEFGLQDRLRPALEIARRWHQGPTFIFAVDWLPPLRPPAATAMLFTSQLKTNLAFLQLAGKGVPLFVLLLTRNWWKALSVGNLILIRWSCISGRQKSSFDYLCTLIVCIWVVQAEMLHRDLVFQSLDL